MAPGDITRLLQIQIRNVYGETEIKKEAEQVKTKGF